MILIILVCTITLYGANIYGENRYHKYWFNDIICMRCCGATV